MAIDLVYGKVYPCVPSHRGSQPSRVIKTRGIPNVQFYMGILFVLANFGFFLLCYRLFGKNGLFAWVGVMTIVANIQVGKTIEMFGIVMTLGNAANASLFMTSDLLNEIWTEGSAPRGFGLDFHAHHDDDYHADGPGLHSARR